MQPGGNYASHHSCSVFLGVYICENIQDNIGMKLYLQGNLFVCVPNLKKCSLINFLNTVCKQRATDI